MTLMIEIDVQGGSDDLRALLRKWAALQKGDDGATGGT